MKLNIDPSISGTKRGEKGITGLETAIILIAFVVVASVFAFTVLSTGIFSSERSKETVYAGLAEAQSSLEPRGSLIAYNGKLSDSTETVFKVSFVVSNAVAGEPIDLTPPFTADDSGTDPDVVSPAAEYVTVVSYTDQNQYLNDVPWSVAWPGYDNSDNILEVNEKAEITVWLLNRATGTDIASDGSVVYMTTEGGMVSTDTVLTTNDEFTVEVKPPSGATLIIERTLPARLDTVMDLK